MDRWSTRSDVLSILQLGTHCFQVRDILGLVGITFIAVLFIFLLCRGYVFLILFFSGCLITFVFTLDSLAECTAKIHRGFLVVDID